MTSFDHSMNDGLTPSSVVGWGTRELNWWSWENILTFSSLRWWFHRSLFFPVPDEDAIVVFGLMNHLTRLTSQIAVPTMTWKTCSAPNQDLNGISMIWIVINLLTVTCGQWRLMRTSDDILPLRAFCDLIQWGTWHYDLTFSVLSCWGGLFGGFVLLKI